MDGSLRFLPVILINLFHAGQDDELIRLQVAGQLSGDAVLLDHGGSALQSMLLRDNGDPAASAGDDHLICVRQRADGIDLQNINGLGRGHDPAEALSRFFHNIVPLFLFGLGILSRHVTADDLGGLIKGLVVGIHRHLRQDRADRLGNTPAQQLRAQGILDIISHIALAHGAADAHGSGRVVDVDPTKLRHRLVDHADLRPVAVRDGELIARLNQIRKRFGGHLHCVLLLCRGISKGLMPQRNDGPFLSRGFSLLRSAFRIRAHMHSLALL